MKIPFQTVQNSIDNICGITEEGDLEKASHHLFDTQPDLGGFFMEFIEDMSESAQDLGFMMALIPHKSLRINIKKLRPMNEDEIVTRFEGNEAEFEKYLKMDDDIITELQEKSQSQGQPEILNYIIEELLMSPDLEPALAVNEHIHLFTHLQILCRTA